MLQKVVNFCFLFVLIQNIRYTNAFEDCSLNNLSETMWLNLSTVVVPNMNGLRKGEAGKIGVIGGSTEYTGAPYFAAISALKVGADLVFVITTESAAPVIKSYSPDLIVYPNLHSKHLPEINKLLNKMDVIVFGPGLGREPETLALIYNIIDTCKELRKPLVIDADGLYALSENVDMLKNYPKPGVILTPNHYEEERLKGAIAKHSPDWPNDWYEYWGDTVTVLVKGKTDSFHGKFPWSNDLDGSSRRAGGQGDILSGSIGTFYKWALDKKLCEDTDDGVKLAQSVASYAAARLTRLCNKKAFAVRSRSMTASDMLDFIQLSFDELYSDEFKYRGIFSY